MDHTSRRAVLRATAAGVVVVGLAGCSGNGGDGDGDGDGNGGTTPIPGSAYPAIDEWLTETDIGGSADNYDGTLVNRTGQDTLTVEVGAEGNGGAFAFGPAAVAVSTGTEVEFSWTGEGGLHNVEALPAEQLGESDYEFSSGEPVDTTGVEYTRTLDETGIVLYHCEPHLSLGMKGAIAVR
jgi:halocyanin-like protein